MDQSDPSPVNEAVVEEIVGSRSSSPVASRRRRKRKKKSKSNKRDRRAVEEDTVQQYTEWERARLGQLAGSLSFATSIRELRDGQCEEQLRRKDRIITGLCKDICEVVQARKERHT